MPDAKKPYSFEFSTEAAREVATNDLIEFLESQGYYTGPAPKVESLMEDGTFGTVAEFCLNSLLQDHGQKPSYVKALLNVLKAHNSAIDDTAGEFGPVARATIRAMRPPVVFTTNRPRRPLKPDRLHHDKASPPPGASLLLFLRSFFLDKKYFSR